MDQSKDKMSMLENLKAAISGYSIEIGDTTYNDTLEERIQAAKAASSATYKQTQKPKEKLSVPLKNVVVEKDTHLENMTIKKLNNIVQVPELKKRNRQRWSSVKTDFVSTSNTFSVDSSINKNLNLNAQANYISTSFKSTCRGGGVMQRRLEAIKASKIISNLPSFEHNTNNTLESIKFSNNPSKNVSSQTLTKNHDYNQFDTNYSKLNEYKTRSIVQKHYGNEINHDYSTLIGPYTKNVICTPSK